MKQMVYVVLDNDEVLGVYDEYAEAEAVVTETATITPVIVGRTDNCRMQCETPEEVIFAMEHELQNLSVLEDEDDWEEEEEDDWDEDEWDEDEDEVEEEDEEESDPVEEIIYEMDGKRVISKEKAAEILQIMRDVIMHDRRVPKEAKNKFIEEMMLDFAKEHDIWGVDMRE